MDASRVLVPVASIKTPAQSLPLALCARPEWVYRLDLATQSSTERTREPETRAKKSNFVNGASSVQSCQSCQPLTRLIWLSSSDRLRSYLRLPGSGHEATRLSPVFWGPPARHGQSFPAEPLDPTKCGPPPSPGPRPAPFFWPAVVSSMELPVPFDQNPRLPPAVPVPPSRRCCCPDCDSFCWRSFD